MKILVLATSYPRPDGFVSLQYIHSRNKWYVQKGIDVSVISFDAKNDYELDNVKVYTLSTYEKKIKSEKFDLLVSHAPNLRNHYRFLKKYSDLYDNIVFFFHGHEVLKTSKVYPPPYSYTKKVKIRTKIRRGIYDNFKLKVWKKYFEKIAYKTQFIFVSKWMYDMFIDSTEIEPEVIEGNKRIIYNCIGENFEKNSYDLKSEKNYDFITIRNNLDGSKYAIDVVTRIAQDNPKYNFCVIGKGEFYEYNDKPRNLEWIEKNLSHNEIIHFLNKSKCALIPTRADAQGVMACEIATFGIPLITSNIDVCKEIFGGFDNVGYINNDDLNINIEPIIKKISISLPTKKNTKYFEENTIGKEIELYENIIK
ncbi:glycosyltransferase [Evansella sp. AB-rgal1]|uniref:glycosyltransferase n=1 Tax=Evansella sp. AB-rgal1 TaxID=3242696 RepID=UPI00359D0A0E